MPHSSEISYRGRVGCHALSLYSATALRPRKARFDSHGSRIQLFLAVARTPDDREPKSLSDFKKVRQALSSYSYSTTIAGVGTQTGTGEATDTVALGGGYLELSAAWWLSNNWALEGSIAQQWMGGFGQAAAGRQSQVGFGSTTRYTVGLAYSF